MRLDLGALEPEPNRMVANLPYAIATPLMLRTIAELGRIESWTLMVQREIADRLRAAPGSRTYGGPSVLVQLACEVRLLRSVDRAVFTPRPRVDSALIGLRRIGPGASPEVARLVRDGVRAPAQVAGALARARADGRPRTGARGAGAARPAGRRPRRAAGAGAVHRARRRACRGAGVILRAPAKLNLCLYLGGARPDGLHELRSLFCPLLLADRIEVTEAEGEADEVVCHGVEGPNLVGVALEAMRARGLAASAAAGRDR